MRSLSRRNFIILAVFLGGVIYGTVFIVDNTETPRRPDPGEEGPKSYVRSLQLQLWKMLGEKRYEEAEIVVRRIVRQAPENRVVQRAAGKIYYCNGKLTEAENVLRTLLLRHPEDALCRNNYAMVLLARGRRESLNELRKAFAASSGSRFILENFRYAAEKLKANEPEPEMKSQGTSPAWPVPPPDAITAPEKKKK